MSAGMDDLRRMCEWSGRHFAHLLTGRLRGRVSTPSSSSRLNTKVPHPLCPSSWLAR
ncbi:unnamed protein product [Protopolystoma xenopodis]|uniref:Uncharacterized protein n=1 Tax=Protopolystoma xenopodis TaxID=117903 RepID=A0A448WWH6_9PLAT|nr:unnamed protein product [Protopolystoma xenopodis]